jgi:hypothetical protein
VYFDFGSRFEGLLGVTHNGAFLVQHVLASNESKHGWMEEVIFLEDLGMNRPKK